MATVGALAALGSLHDPLDPLIRTRIVDAVDVPAFACGEVIAERETRLGDLRDEGDTSRLIRVSQSKGRGRVRKE